MIIDAHVHVTANGQWFHTGYDASVKRLLREMDETEVDRAILIALAGHIENDFIASVVAEHRDRFWGLGSVNPDDERAVNEVYRCHDDLGLVGLKLHPRLCGWNEDSKEVYKVLEAASNLNMPVMLDTMLYTRNHIPKRPAHDVLAEWAFAFPELTLILAHAGCHRIMDAFEVAKCFPNIYLDISFLIEKYKGSALLLDIGYVMDHLDQRIIYGSDFPEFSIGTYLETAKSLVANRPNCDQTSIFGYNVMKVYRTTI